MDNECLLNKTDVSIEELAAQMKDFKERYLATILKKPTQETAYAVEGDKCKHNISQDIRDSKYLHEFKRGTRTEKRYASSDEIHVDTLNLKPARYQGRQTRSGENNTRLKCTDGSLNRSYSAPMSITPTGNNERINQHCLHDDEIDYLRNSQRHLIREIDRLKHANISQKKQLQEEVQLRHRIQNDLSEIKTMLFNQTTRKDEHRSIDVLKNNTGSLTKNDIEDETSHISSDIPGCESSTSHLQFRNKELGRQLKAAKRTLKSQEEKLLVFSQFFSNLNNVHPHNHSFPAPSKLTLAAHDSVKHNHSNLNRKSSTHGNFINWNYETRKYEDSLPSITYSSDSVYSDQYESLDIIPK